LWIGNLIGLAHDGEVEIASATARKHIYSGYGFVSFSLHI